MGDSLKLLSHFMPERRGRAVQEVPRSAPPRDIKRQAATVEKKQELALPRVIGGFVSVGFSGTAKRFPSRFINTPQNLPILFAPETETGMEGWNTETNWSRDVLEHIVALLFGLAHLADLAAGLSSRRRQQVLGILSHGEVEARALIVGMATDDPIPADALEQVGDAARLAASFRVLAFALSFLLARRFAPPGADGLRAGRPPHGISGPAVCRLDAPAPSAPDTS